MKKNIEKNKYGTEAMVYGIIGFCLSFLPIAGLLLSIKALKMSEMQKEIKENGQSITGKVLGILGIIIGVASTFLFVTTFVPIIFFAFAI